MTRAPVYLDIVVRSSVGLCWLVLVAALLFRKKPWEVPGLKRDWTSMVGVALQSVAFVIVPLWRRERLTPIVQLGVSIEIALAIATIGLGLGSVWITLAAISTLGKQWSVAAKMVEGHRLVTEGLYGVVRHPIYAGYFGLLLATGLAFSHLRALLLAILLFWTGAVIRIRTEERLLREEFGQEFEAYARRVPAVFPRLRRDS